MPVDYLPPGESPTDGLSVGAHHRAYPAALQLRRTDEADGDHCRWWTRDVLEMHPDDAARLEHQDGETGPARERARRSRCARR